MLILVLICVIMILSVVGSRSMLISEEGRKGGFGWVVFCGLVDVEID